MENNNRYNTNNGIALVTDDLGHPYIVAEATPDFMDQIREMGAQRDSRLYVPHSDDGGKWLQEMREKAAKK